MKRAFVGLALCGAALVLWLCVRTPRLHEVSATQPTGQVDAAGHVAVAPQVPARGADAGPPPSAARRASPARAQPAAADEATFMNELRRVAESDPVRGLALARDGERRYPNGDAAAERGAIIVRSLARQGRLSEARGEAELMVQRHHGTRWALEVEQQTGAHPRVDH